LLRARLSFFFSSRRRHTRSKRDWSSDVCSSDLVLDAYWDWLEGRILAPIKEQFPEVYGWLVGRYSSYVVKIIEAQSSEMELSVEIGRGSCRERVYIWVVEI